MKIVARPTASVARGWIGGGCRQSLSVGGVRAFGSGKKCYGL